MKEFAPDLPLWDGPDTLSVKVARAALLEAGRPDLAANVVPNRAGVPMSRHTDDDRDVVVKAFCLGHVAEGHHAVVTYLDGEAGIECQECFDRTIRLAEAGAA